MRSAPPAAVGDAAEGAGLVESLAASLEPLHATVIVAARATAMSFMNATPSGQLMKSHRGRFPSSATLCNSPVTVGCSRGAPRARTATRPGRADFTRSSAECTDQRREDIAVVLPIMPQSQRFSVPSVPVLRRPKLALYQCPASIACERIQEAMAERSTRSVVGTPST